MTDHNRHQYMIDKIHKAPPAKWVQEMQEHFRRTGTYRQKDIRRVMGNQTESVKFDSDSTRAALKLSR